ncbi:MAG: endonuclease/exonuclease/phosphatase family protein [Spirochaetes bacterium]|nr:endonuclease/exonuclease/phosphatase family protein [Spirochaetota bacterium]
MKGPGISPLVSAFFLVSALGCVPPGYSLTYTVLTYNIGLLRILGIDLVPAVDARTRIAPRELARFARQNAPDIMLLEEVWDNRTAAAIEGELSPLGYASVRPRGRGPGCLGSGLLLLVRSPLEVVDWSYTPFAKNTFSNSFARKGVLGALLEDPSEPGARFALVGTHTVALDTVKGQPKHKTQLAAFHAQAAQVLSVLDARSSQGSVPVILLGDFNVGPGYADAAYRRIAGEEGVIEAGESVGFSAPRVTWDPLNPLVRYGRYPDEPPAKIDHVFLRDGGFSRWKVLGVRRVFEVPVVGITMRPSKRADAIEVPLSDHYGFLAEVELTRARP